MNNEKKSILIVEDSPTQAIELEFFLKEGGFDVRTAIDGEDALKHLSCNKPDLIVTDLMQLVKAVFHPM